MNKTLLLSCFLSGFVLSDLAAQNEIIWEAYNDYRPGDSTHPNVSDYDLRITDDGGPLRDFATGDDLEAEVIVIHEGGNPDDFGANSPVDPDTPADILFRDKVEIGNEGTPGTESLQRRVADPQLPKSGSDQAVTCSEGP